MASIKKLISFNTHKERDLLNLIDELGKGNYAPWIKDQMRLEIRRRRSGSVLDPDLLEAVRRVVGEMGLSRLTTAASEDFPLNSGPDNEDPYPSSPHNEIPLPDRISQSIKGMLRIG